MKKDIHPSNYREVVFKDMSNDEIFITRSTIAAKETIEVDGVTYPLVKLEITSSSHPFFTGKQKLVDTGEHGRSPEAALRERQGRRQGRGGSGRREGFGRGPSEATHGDREERRDFPRFHPG